MNCKLSSIGISVIIPCYNSQDTIDKALRSIVDQLTDDMEIIVIDDGSIDKTAQVVSKYSQIVRYVYQNNSGVSAARNLGVRLASREWIAFCDSDDIWLPYKVKICKATIKNNIDCSFLFHDFSISYEEKIVAERGSHSKHNFFPALKHYSISIPEILCEYPKIVLKNSIEEGDSIDIYSGNCFSWLILGNFIMPSSVMIKRKLFLAQGGFDPEFKVAEDSEFFLRLAKTTRFFYIDHPLHVYKRSSKSLVSMHLKELLEYGIKGVEKNCSSNEIVREKYKERINASLGRRKADLAYLYLSELNKKQALINAIIALKYNIISLKAWSVILWTLVPRQLLGLARDIKKRIKCRN